MILPPPPAERVGKKVRKGLSADALYALLRSGFEKIDDDRNEKATISLPDALMSAFDMFSLKDPSLLAFELRRNDENMKNLYRILTVPSDTRMREILDPLKPEDFRGNVAVQQKFDNRPPIHILRRHSRECGCRPFGRAIPPPARSGTGLPGQL